MERKKVLGFWDLVLFSFCAIFGVEAIATAAAIGPSAISWWLIFIIGYFLPYGLIAAELGAAYPEQGGLYAWVKRAFGRKWAARTTWYYWLSLPIWVPAIYIASAEILGKLFFPGLTLWDQVLIGIALIWATVAVNLFPLQSSKWVTNFGSVSKLVIIVGMAAAAAMFFLKHGHFANEINLVNILPAFNTAVVFIPIIIYNLLGCELISSAAAEMKDPKKDVPKAVIMSALAIASLYLISTILIWAVVPASQISVSNGILQMFHVAFGVQGMGAAVSVFIGILIIGTLFTGVVAWTLGQNRSIAEAADSGEMPKVFGLVNRYGAPAGASVISGIVSTAVIIVYWYFADTASDMFWHVTAFCLVVELLSYMVLFPAYIALKKDKSVSRPYKVPGGDRFAVFLAVVAEVFLIVTVIILCIQPGKDFVWTALPVIAGSIVSVASGEILIDYSLKKYKT